MENPAHQKHITESSRYSIMDAVLVTSSFTVKPRGKFRVEPSTSARDIAIIKSGQTIIRQ
jgi:hypothetical protein